MLSATAVGFAAIGALLGLMAIRIPIAVALIVVSFLGLAVVRDINVAIGLVRSVPFDFAAHWSLTAIPMFLLMGAVAYHTGISADLFRAARLWLSGLPGGLAVAANFACAGFSAASGSSVATAAAMGRIAVPEMLAHGYDKGLATGVVASAGTLGSLIPPSILFVLYGVFAEVSIPKLFIAGVLPGVLTALVYGSMIVLRCRLDPSIAPPADVRAAPGEKRAALLSVWPLAALVGGIIGGLYAGVVTPTEAGAFGAFLSFLIAAVKRKLTWRIVYLSLRETIINNARIFFVAIGAVLFARFLAITALPVYLGTLVDAWALNELALIVIVAALYLILGMFLDPIGVMLLSLPILLPMLDAADFNLIWFGVIVVKFLEIGLITPPVGFNVYVIHSVVGKDVPLESIFKGVAWFIVCDLLVLVLIISYPEIALLLPGYMD